jgi:RHH-type transcriptional regulator, proline utilization regulon repressor / proline dehydrogenase / delta 1-pyrroline-5-carboxylate dehydrogenase
MLAGAMAELKWSATRPASTDVGPVIDADAQGHPRSARRAHGPRGALDRRAAAAACAHGTFFAPRAYEIAIAAQLTARCSARCCT